MQRISAPLTALVYSFLVAAAATFLTGRASADEKPDAARPNVLFIIADDLTADGLHCYGNAQCQSPHLDKLAARGVRFTRTYCQYPVCGAARAALMSGMYPQVNGVVGNGSSGKFTATMGKRQTMSQRFKDAGYYTARVSKIYHMRVPGDITAGVDGPDHAASWTERYNCQAPEWMTKGEHEHLTREKLNRDPNKHYGLGFGSAFYVVKGASDGAEQADVQAATKAIELMKKHRDEPFFLAVGLVRPHVPLVAPGSYFEPYKPMVMKLAPKIENDQLDIPAEGLGGSSKARGLAGKTLSQQKVLAAYYACITFMDAQVGRMLNALDELKLREKTIVVFCSDHGYHLGEHDLWQKMSLHDESARIPLIISAPGYQPAVCNALTEQVDIYPTLADLAGLSTPPHCQGVSLVKLLKEPDVNVRDSAYCLRNKAHLLRTDRWAYIQYPRGGQELYDMQNDPKQYTNLVDKAEHADTLANMKQRLKEKLQLISVDPAKPVRIRNK